MSNPYMPAHAGNPANNDATPSRPNKGLSLFATSASVIAILVFSLIALMLILQATRLASQDAGMPPRLQGGLSSMIRGSWIGGWTAITCLVANMVGIWLIRKGRIGISFAICGISVLCMVGIAIACKPV